MRFDISSAFVRQSLALTFLLSVASCFSVVVNSECSRSWGSLVVVPFVSTIFFGDSLLVFLVFREILLRLI